MEMAGASDLNEKGEAVVAAADGGFTPFAGATLKRQKSFGGGAAAAVRANLRRQQSLKQGRSVGTIDDTLASDGSDALNFVYPNRMSLSSCCPVRVLSILGLLDALGGSTLSRSATIG